MNTKKRKLVTNVREYLRGLSDTKLALNWVWQNVIGSAGRTWVRKLLLVTACTLGIGALDPFIVSFIVTGLIQKNLSLVMYSIAALCVCLILKKWIDLKRDKFREYMFCEHSENLNTAVMAGFFEKSVGQHMQYSQNLSTNHIEKGRGKILTLLNVVLFDGMVTAFNLVISITCIFFFNFIAGGVVLVVLVTYVIWSMFLNTKVMVAMRPIDEELKEISNRVTERMDGYERVITNTKPLQEISRFRNDYTKVITRNCAFWIRFLDMIFGRSVLNTLGYISIVAWSSYQVWIGNLAIGLVFPIFAWARTISDNLWRIGDIEFHINWHLPGISSMLEALTMRPAVQVIEGAIHVTNDTPLSVSFSNVSLSYPSDRQADGVEDEHLAVLSNLSFDIASGEKVALLGPSGAGKSTAMRLVLRQMDVTSGEILVNGTPITRIDLRSYLGKVGYIPQHPTVFDGTLRENVIYGLSEDRQQAITDDEIWEVLRMLQTDFGRRLTNGLETRVGKNGLKLSGGEMQRLMIAAAVMKRPSLMVVDEATSSLDPTTEKKVQAGLETALSGKASALIVAHRLSTVRHMDKFILLRPTSILEPGMDQIEAVAHSFEELFDVSATFRRLALDQDLKIEGVRAAA